MALRRPRPAPLHDYDGLRTLASRQPNAEERAADRELHRMILEAIDTLSDINREAVIGFYLDGYSYQELEDLLDIPVDKIRSRLFKARRTLRKVLSPVAQDYIPDIAFKKEYSMKQPEQVEAEIQRVMELYMADETLLTLHVIGQEQYLSVRLTSDESRALEYALREDTQGAPASHDLTCRMLEQMGAEVRQVVIDRLVERQCIARITYALGDTAYNLDVRVGEALSRSAL